jgi:CheY-like chemotaxis protein
MTDQQKKLRVLIVDDMPDIIMLLRHFVSRTIRSEITDAGDGLVAIEKLFSFTPDVIITDLHMPTMTGLEFIGFVIRQPQYVDIPIIIMTTDSDDRTQITAAGLKVHSYLSKPFNPTTLKKALKEVVPDEYFY